MAKRMKAAIILTCRKQQQDKGRVLEDTYSDEQTSVSPQWRETAQMPRQEESGSVPLPPEP